MYLTLIRFGFLERLHFSILCLALFGKTSFHLFLYLFSFCFSVSISQVKQFTKMVFC